MHKPKIAIVDGSFPNFDQEMSLLGALDGSVVIGQCRTEDEVIALARDSDAVLVQWAPVSRRVLGNLTRCKIVARYGLGVDMIDVQAASERGIAVTNAGDYCTLEVAEHTVAMVLACARKLKVLDQYVRDGLWDTIAAAAPVERFSKRTVGILGFGTIGEMVAARLHGLGFSVLVSDPFSAKPPEPYRQVDLETLLRESDFLTIHVPLTAATRGLFNRERFQQMKRTAFVVNTSRGPVIRETDLISAIQAGEIAGAALDVFEGEPPGKDSPLLADRRALLTPHAAYYSEDSLRALQSNPAEEIVRFFRGEPLRWMLNAADLRRDS